MRKQRKVRPEDFNVEALMAAAREGRLFLEERHSPANRQEVGEAIHAYVERIRALVCPRYCTVIDALWDEIFQCDVLMDVLMPKPKARKCKDFDKYGVMRMVGVLRARGVYEQRSDPFFDALLEEPGKDSPYRRYLGQGLENRNLLVAVKQIVENFNILVK